MVASAPLGWTVVISIESDILIEVLGNYGVELLKQSELLRERRVIL